MRKQKMTYSKLHCKECGNIFSVPRKQSKRREHGHIKDLYCIKCGCTTKHVEDNRSKAEIEWDKIQEELWDRKYEKV
nr:MAG TPA: DNA-directed RNA polymerase [Herelleviridae sp.]